MATPPPAPATAGRRMVRRPRGAVRSKGRGQTRGPGRQCGPRHFKPQGYPNPPPRSCPGIPVPGARHRPTGTLHPRSARGVQHRSASEGWSSGLCARSADRAPDATRQRVSPPASEISDIRFSRVCQRDAGKYGTAAHGQRLSLFPRDAGSGWSPGAARGRQDGARQGRVTRSAAVRRKRGQAIGATEAPAGTAVRSEPDGKDRSHRRMRWIGNRRLPDRDTEAEVGAVRGTAGPRRRHPSVGTKRNRHRERRQPQSPAGATAWSRRPQGTHPGTAPSRTPRAPSRRPAWSGRRAHRSTRLLAPDWGVHCPVSSDLTRPQFGPTTQISLRRRELGFGANRLDNRLLK